mmetsp:Transcript_36947/g.86315  ORF Transcript_36947/g.86315 Transcript_36947/m.86315 type:complete len:154 (-) Transcript_36947:200-661(-)
MDEDCARPNVSSSEQGLPRSTVAKLIKDVTPPDFKCSPDAQALLNECLSEFIQMLTAEANEQSSKEKKNTLSEAHVLSALKTLGFERYAAACEGDGIKYQNSKAALRAEHKRKRKVQQSQISEEELTRMQQELFAGARQRMATEQSGVSDPLL